MQRVALDLYGGAKIGHTNEEKMALMQPMLEDRKLLQKRLLASFQAVEKEPFFDPNKCAAVGFCFGGLAALDLARAGVNLQGVISVHGLLTPPPFPNQKIQPKILTLHGYQDPDGAS